MNSEQKLQNECLFCSQIHPQKKYLFFVLSKMLYKQLQKLTSKCPLQTNQTQFNNFKQILRIIFGEQARKYENICTHKKYYKYFMMKLKCSEPELNQICIKLSQVLSERNYHLELLSSQIKNSGQRISEGKISLQEIESERIASSRSKRMKQLRRKQIRSEKQGSPLITSMNFLPIYNSEANIDPTQTSISPNNVTSVTSTNITFYYPYNLYFQP